MKPPNDFNPRTIELWIVENDQLLQKMFIGAEERLVEDDYDDIYSYYLGLGCRITSLITPNATDDEYSLLSSMLGHYKMFEDGVRNGLLIKTLKDNIFVYGAINDRNNK